MSSANLSSLRDFIAPETLEAMPFPVGVYSAEEIIVAVNARMEEMLGVSREHLVGCVRLSDFEGNPEYTTSLASGRRALAGETTSVPPFRSNLRNVERISSHTQRQVVWMDAVYFPLRDAEGRIRFLMVVCQDQTVMMEERLALEAARGEIETQQATIRALEAAQGEIEAQRATIQALSSPIIEVWRGVLALPVIGHVNAARSADMMSRLLAAIARTRSRYAILDLTGVSLVDAPTADSFITMIRAVELLGAQGILVGIQPAISRALVELGVELGGLRSFRTLGDALEACMRDMRGPGAIPGGA